MKNYSFLDVLNSQSVPFEQIPVFEADDFREKVIDAVNNGRRKLSALFALKKEELNQVIVVLSNPRLHRFELASFMVKDSYNSFTVSAPVFEYFERELHEDTGIIPLNHPNLKPVRKIREDKTIEQLNQMEYRRITTIVQERAELKFAAFQKQLNLTGVRIPCQGMTSFAPMRIAMFVDTDVNAVYVPTTIT